MATLYFPGGFGCEEPNNYTDRNDEYIVKQTDKHSASMVRLTHPALPP